MSSRDKDSTSPRKRCAISKEHAFERRSVAPHHLHRPSASGSLGRATRQPLTVVSINSYPEPRNLYAGIASRRKEHRRSVDASLESTKLVEQCARGSLVSKPSLTAPSPKVDF